MSWWRRPLDHLIDTVGGKTRAKVIVTLAAVFALDGADLGAIGAMAVPMQHDLHIDKAELGLLLTASLGVGALATLPFGVLIDRRRRTRVLAWAILGWGVVMLASAASPSYTFLLVTRMLLGAGTACAAPGVASLVGDLFAPEERGRIYGYVISGDLVGTAIGVVVSGMLASWSWRAGLAVLGPPALVVSYAVHRLAEPERGGTTRLESTVARTEGAAPPHTLLGLVRERGVEPRPELLLESDPRACSFWWSVRYVLRIPTNLVLIIASALAYFYLAGLRGFAIEYLHLRYAVSHEWSLVLALVLGVGAISGVLVAGRLADALMQRGHVRARVAVAMVAYFITVALVVPGLFVPGLVLAMVLFALGAAGLGAIGPPLDGARLDIMVPALWGRAEAVRVFLRKAGEASAPFAFGLVADHFATSPDRGVGLEIAFLVMLVAIIAGGLIALIALRTYLRDVATAGVNQQRFSRRRDRSRDAGDPAAAAASPG